MKYKVPVFDAAYRQRLAWNERGMAIGTAVLKVLRERHFIAQPYGPDGCAVSFLPSLKSGHATTTLIVSRSDHWGAEWVHASIAHTDRMPTYVELAAMHKAVFGEGFAYQVFASSAEHVNIHEHALHLWGLDSGAAALPNFGESGTI